MGNEETAEFINTTEGQLGVIRKIGDKFEGRSVGPGEHVHLTEEEQVQTANAPKTAEANPFLPDDESKVAPLELVTRPRPIGAKTGERPIGTPDGITEPDRDAIGDEVGAAVPPAGDPEEGEFQAGEEVATPAAAGAGKPDGWEPGGARPAHAPPVPNLAENQA